LDCRDRALLEEAAELYRVAGDREACGDVYARIGYNNKAAEAWTEAGAVDKLEEAYLLDEISTSSRRERHRLVDDFRLAEEAGMLLEAKEAIDGALALEPDNPAIRDLHRRFHARMPPAGKLRLEVENGDPALIPLTTDVLTLGRDEHANITLLAPGVSRIHTRLFQGEGQIFAEDMGSKNGTLVDEVRADTPIALAQEGILQLGDRCTLAYARQNAMVLLEPDQPFGGRTVYLWGQGCELDTSWFPVPMRLSVVGGYWHLLPGRAHRVEGRLVTAPILLRVDALIERDGAPPVRVRP